MGYAIFAARKIMLTSRINNLNWRIMCLSQKQQSLSDISGRMQEYFGTMSMALGKRCESIFKGQNLGAQWNNQNASELDELYSKSFLYRDTFANMHAQLNAAQQIIMKPVAAQENQIDLERKRLETQLQSASKELEAVEQQEKTEIDRSAPKYA